MGPRASEYDALDLGEAHRPALPADSPYPVAGAGIRGRHYAPGPDRLDPALDHQLPAHRLLRYRHRPDVRADDAYPAAALRGERLCAAVPAAARRSGRRSADVRAAGAALSADRQPRPVP